MQDMAQPNKTPERVYFLDYAKAFITALVVAQHVAFAYTTYAGYYAENYILSSAPVIDPSRWFGINVFEDFNDKFFMSLMFFIAGIFTFSSVKRKGLSKYLTDRIVRLGLPFTFVAFFLAPLSYYPAFMAVGGTGPYLDFWFQDFLPMHWLPGPVWFIWVLLTFSILGGFLVDFMPRALERISRKVKALEKKPWEFYFWALGLTGLIYTFFYYLIPGNGPETWFTLAGPLWCQKNRIGLYFLVFCLGLGTGSHGAQLTAFASSSKVVKAWPWWLLAALVAHISMVYIENTETPAFSEFFRFWSWVPLFLNTLICASIAVIGVFSTYFNKKNKTLQWLAANAYTVYLIHFPIVIWLQYSLLKVEWHAAAKFGVVTTLALVISWACSSLIRKIPILGKVL